MSDKRITLPLSAINILHYIYVGNAMSVIKLPQNAEEFKKLEAQLAEKKGHIFDSETLLRSGEWRRYDLDLSHSYYSNISGKFVGKSSQIVSVSVRPSGQAHLLFELHHDVKNFLAKDGTYYMQGPEHIVEKILSFVVYLTQSNAEKDAVIEMRVRNGQGEFEQTHFMFYEEEVGMVHEIHHQSSGSTQLFDHNFILEPLSHHSFVFDEFRNFASGNRANNIDTRSAGEQILAGNTPAIVGDKLSVIDEDGKPHNPITGHILDADNAHDNEGQTLHLVSISFKDPLDPTGKAIVQMIIPTDGSAIAKTAYGSLTVFSDGRYSYQLDTNKVQYLINGEKLFDLFNVKTTDGFAETLSTLNVEIQGVTDGIVLSSDSKTISEDDAQIISSNVFDNDMKGPENTGLTLTSITYITRDGNEATQVIGQQPVKVITQYGELTIGSDGRYSYDLNNNLPVVQQLTSNTSLKDTITYHASGDRAGTGSTSLTIKILGAEDIFKIKPIGNANDYLEEDNPSHRINEGNVLDNLENTAGGDVELRGEFSVKIGSEKFTGILGKWVETTYGKAIVYADGRYHYELNNDLVATQQLKDIGPDSVKAYITMTAYSKVLNQTTDGVVEIDIWGQKDQFTIANSIAADVKEDTPAQTVSSGNVLTNNITDSVPDSVGNPDKVVGTVYISNGSKIISGKVGEVITTDYGSFILKKNGDFEYRIDNSLAAVQALNEGDSRLQAIKFTAENGIGMQGTAETRLNVLGSRDLPTVLEQTRDMFESTSLDNSHSAITGNLLANVAATKITSIEGGSVGSAVSGKYGLFTLNEDGSYHYRLYAENENPAQAAVVNKLTTGQTLADESFSYQAGGETAKFNVMIRGVNDKPDLTLGFQSKTIEPNEFSFSFNSFKENDFPKILRGLDEKAEQNIFDANPLAAQALGTGPIPVQPGSTFDVVLERERGWYNNTIGVYKIDKNGMIYDVKIVWIDSSGNVPIAPSGDSGNLIEGVSKKTFTVDSSETNVSIGFFLISDGGRNGSWNRMDLNSLSFKNQNGENVNIYKDNWQSIYLQDGQGDRLSGSPQIFHSASPNLSTEGYEQTLSGRGSDPSIGYVGFEDRNRQDFPNDNSFNDVTLKIVGSKALAFQPSSVASGADILNIDGGNITKLVVSLTAHLTKDYLRLQDIENISQDGLTVRFGYPEDGTGEKYPNMLIIEGNASADVYKKWLQNIIAESDNEVPVVGTRVIKFELFDENGLADVETFHLHVQTTPGTNEPGMVDKHLLSTHLVADMDEMGREIFSFSFRQNQQSEDPEGHYIIDFQSGDKIDLSNVLGSRDNPNADLIKTSDDLEFHYNQKNGTLDVYAKYNDFHFAIALHENTSEAAQDLQHDLLDLSDGDGIIF